MENGSVDGLLLLRRVLRAHLHFRLSALTLPRHPSSVPLTVNKVMKKLFFFVGLDFAPEPEVSAKFLHMQTQTIYKQHG